MIIGLMGYGRSGKDTVAEILGEIYDFKRYAFADALKEVAEEVDPFIQVPYMGHRRLSEVLKDLGWDAAKAFPDVRQLIQRLGMAGRKHIHEDVWLNAVTQQLAWDGPRNAVITDVRFHNEADWIERVGVLVRVTRPGVGPVNGHESETEVDAREAAYHLANDGDTDDLIAAAMKMVVALRA